MKRLSIGSEERSSLRRQKRNASRAAACYQEARDVARRQRAKSMELRAATSLAKIRTEEGQRDEARDFLATVYDWFTEGFDTPDLRDAKALLDELN